MSTHAHSQELAEQVHLKMSNLSDQHLLKLVIALQKQTKSIHDTRDAVNPCAPTPSDPPGDHPLWLVIDSCIFEVPCSREAVGSSFANLNMQWTRLTKEVLLNLRIRRTLQLHANMSIEVY